MSAVERWLSLDVDTGDAARGAVRLPRWMTTSVIALLAAVTGFGLVGLLLAVGAVFLPLFVVPIGLVATVLLFRAAGARRVVCVPRRGDSLCAIGAVALAVAGMVDNLRHSAQHLLIGRDPGAYVNTGRWLATHRSLVFDAANGAFAGTPGLKYSSPGIYGGGRNMHFQFSHLLGVLLAEARWVGGDRAMFALPAILGAVSVVVFYALACRFVRPVLALVATAALATNVVQLHFTRDAYSEIVVQLAMLGGLWVLGLGGLRAGGLSRARFAGVLLGTIVAARLDGPLYIAAIPVLLVLAAARDRAGASDAATDDDDDGVRTDVVRTIAWAAGAVAFLGILDVAVRVPEYIGEVGWRVAAEYGGLIVLSVAAVAIGRRSEQWRARFARAPRLPTIVGAALGAVLLALWLVRPYVGDVRGKSITLVGQIQAAHGLRVDQHLRYYEDAMRWLAWYLGPFALAAGIVGVALFVRETIRTGTIVRWTLMVAFGVVALVYLWNASITPDQIWAMRRFLPIVIPGFLLFAVISLEWCLRRLARAGVVVVAALAIAFVAWPVSASLPVRNERTQPGMLDAVHATCRALGPHAAVVVLNGISQLYRQIPQALRGFCGVPVAIRTDDFDDTTFPELARRWRADGRVLHVFADSTARIQQAIPNAQPVITATASNDRLLDQTVDRPPRTYIKRLDTFVIATVPTG